MKNSKINLKLMTLFLALFAFVATDAMAQRAGRGYGNRQDRCDGSGPGMGYGRGDMDCTTIIPSLTEDQQKNIDQLRTAHLKKAQLLRAKLQEEQARLNTLRIEDSDEKAINGSIDKITAMRGELMKERESHRRQVRNLLTEDQKVRFDAKRGNRGRNNSDGARYDGRGNGKGYRNQSGDQ